MLVIINATTFIHVIFTNSDICMVWENIRDAPIPIYCSIGYQYRG